MIHLTVSFRVSECGPLLLDFSSWLPDLEQEGIEVQVVDATALANWWRDLTSLVSSSKAEVTGITCSATCLSPEAVQTIQLCRQLSPQSILIAGGSHFTSMAEQILQEIKALDYIVLGEGELSFTELLRNF